MGRGFTNPPSPHECCIQRMAVRLLLKRGRAKGGYRYSAMDVLHATTEDRHTGCGAVKGMGRCKKERGGLQKMQAQSTTLLTCSRHPGGLKKKRRESYKIGYKIRESEVGDTML